MKQRITISTERPQLQFILKDKGNYYQLSLQYLLRGTPIKSPLENAMFFVCDGTQYYLLASLRDKAIMNWMNSYDISVLKSGFQALEKCFFKNNKYFQMKDKNHTDVKCEELLHDVTDRLDCA